MLADLQRVIGDLDWLRAILIGGTTAGGGFGIFRLWKLFSSDFLTPYREDMTETRTRLDKAEAEVAAARAETAAIRTALYGCQEREQKLRLDLIKIGIQLPPPPTDGEDEPHES